MKPHSRYPHIRGLYGPTAGTSAVPVAGTLDPGTAYGVPGGPIADSSAAQEAAEAGTSAAPMLAERASESAPGLVGKFLGEKVPIRRRPVALVMSLAWLIVISWVFVRDNELGKLGDYGGLAWLGIKAGIYTAVFLAAMLLIVLVVIKPIDNDPRKR